MIMEVYTDYFNNSPKRSIYINSSSSEYIFVADITDNSFCLSCPTCVSSYRNITFPSTYLSSYNDIIIKDCTNQFGTPTKSKRFATSVIDGYGTLITPLGTFDAIRQKYIATTDSVFGLRGSTGQVDSLTSVTNDTLNAYRWWVQGIGVPVLEMTVYSNTTLLTYVYKISSVVTHLKDNFGDANIFFYPNPVNLSTTLSCNKELKNASCKIVNVLGKELRSTNFSGQQTLIEKGDLNPGIYFVQVVSEKEIIATKKLVIE